MSIWKNCSCDIYYPDRSAALNDTGYEVRIDGDELVVSYESEDGWVNYAGKDLGGGHFEVRASTDSGSAVNGRSVLHRSTPDASILEGYWEEEGCRGMWRIYLNP